MGTSPKATAILTDDPSKVLILSDRENKEYLLQVKESLHKVGLPIPELVLSQY
jgi:hypothetical protein